MQQPMATNDIGLLSTLGENQYFDRKSARKDDKEIAKHISAFANASGGKLVIGIEDNGGDIGKKVCLGLFAGMGPRIARVKLAPYHRVAPSRHGLVP